MHDGTTTVPQVEYTLIARFESLDQVLEAIARTRRWILFTRRAYRDYEEARMQELETDLDFISRSWAIKEARGTGRFGGPHIEIARRHSVRRTFRKSKSKGTK